MGGSIRINLSESTLEWESSAQLPVIDSNDPDFGVFLIPYETLLEIQSEAESRGWATRWSSVQALRSQVMEEDVLLQSLMREERSGAVRTYRCLLLFSVVDGNRAGGITTIDLDPTRYRSLDRIDQDPNVRKALVRMFSLALGGISGVTKG